MTTSLRAARVYSAISGLILTAVASSGCQLHLSPDIEAKEEWNRSYTVKPGATLDIRDTNGRIRIEAADGDTIDVKATKIVRAPDETAAKAALSEFQIAETATADRVELDSTTKGISLTIGLSRSVNYNVTVPRWLNVVVRTTNGDIEVTGVAGQFKATTTNGRVVALGLEQGAEVEATNGLIRLDFAKLGDAGVRCDTTNGTISVTLPRDAKARVSAHVSNGRISTENLQMETTEQSRRRLEGTLGGGGATVRLETTNGAIDIRGR